MRTAKTLLTKRVLPLWPMSRPGVILGKGRGKTPTPWLTLGSRRGKTPPQHSAVAGIFPMPHPFWVGGSPGRSGIFPADQRVPGAAIMGNINFLPSRGTPGLLALPAIKWPMGGCTTVGKPSPASPPSASRFLVTQYIVSLYNHTFIG